MASMLFSPSCQCHHDNYISNPSCTSRSSNDTVSSQSSCRPEKPLSKVSVILLTRYLASTERAQAHSRPPVHFLVSQREASSRRDCRRLSKFLFTRCCQWTRGRWFTQCRRSRRPSACFGLHVHLYCVSRSESAVLSNKATSLWSPRSSAIFTQKLPQLIAVDVLPNPKLFQNLSIAILHTFPNTLRNFFVRRT